MSLLAGLVLLNGLLLGAGYCVIAGPLAGRALRCWISYAGVAFMVGAGVVGTGVSFAYVAGAPNGVVALAATLGCVALLGIGAGVASPRWRTALPTPRAREDRRGTAVVIAETAFFTALAAVAIILLIGGVRSSPWLDDVWAIWVPKGHTLDRIGLDPRVFVPEPRYLGFGVPQYPLWWPSITGLDLRFVRYVDLRAVAAQDTLLLVGFLGAVARLLWAQVRPWILGGSLLLVAASPELARHARGGLADLPLGLYLALCGLAAFCWLTRGSGLHLALTVLFGATALQIKTEAGPQLAILAVFSLAGVRVAGGRPVRALAAAWAAAAVFAVPWLIWVADNDVHAEGTVSLRHALSPSYLADRAGRIAPAAETIGRQLVDRSEWLALVPLSLLLALAVTIRERRARWLVPSLLLSVLYLFWIWIYWTDPNRLDYVIGTSSYRVVDATVLLSAIGIPITAERLLSASPCSTPCRTTSRRA
jgi:hypothetical protein